jgi:isocitrate lyase
VNILMREPAGNQENTNLVTRLSNSPVLGDVKEIQANRTRNDMMERRFVMTARVDTQEESVIAKEAEEEERRLEQKRREEERAAKEKAEAEERARQKAQEENEEGDEEEAGQTRTVPIQGRTNAAEAPGM